MQGPGKVDWQEAIPDVTDPQPKQVPGIRWGAKKEENAIVRMCCKENVGMKTRCTGPSEMRQGDFRCSQSLIFSSLPLLATLTKVISASFVPR